MQYIILNKGILGIQSQLFYYADPLIISEHNKYREGISVINYGRSLLTNVSNMGAGLLEITTIHQPSRKDKWTFKTIIKKFEIKMQQLKY